MRFILAAAMAMAALALALPTAQTQPAKSAASSDIKGLKLADPQPAAATLQPGLSVTYRYGIINNVSEINDTPGEVGAPLPQLNYNMGFGKVLTSRFDDGVMARIIGFIKLDKPGQWKFAVKSNDGVRMEIGGKKVYELPGVHSDVMSEVVGMSIDQPGWYAVKILYFEKRESATLELYLAAPGVDNLDIAPAAVFAHIKG